MGISLSPPQWPLCVIVPKALAIFFNYFWGDILREPPRRREGNNCCRVVKIALGRAILKKPDRQEVD